MHSQKAIIALLLLLSFSYAKGQDKIITLQNDTILCRIVTVTPTRIQYEQKIDNQQHTTGKFISIEQVREYYRESQLHETSSPVLKIKPASEPFDRWRVGIRGGGAYLLSAFSNVEKNMHNLGIPQSKIDDYNKQLRNGTCFGADIHYFITPFFGAGVNYSLFANSVQLDYILGLNLYYDFSNSVPIYLGYSIPSYYSVNEKSKFYVNYIGPSVVFRHWLDKSRKFRLNEELSIGYARYREENRIDLYQYTFLSNTLMEGNALGGNIQLSFEYYPMSWLSVGANAGVSLTTFKSVKITTKDESQAIDLDADNHLNMSRFDYSLGIRFHF